MVQMNQFQDLLTTLNSNWLFEQLILNSNQLYKLFIIILITIYYSQIKYYCSIQVYYKQNSHQSHEHSQPTQPLRHTINTLNTLNTPLLHIYLLKNLTIIKKNIKKYNHNYHHIHYQSTPKNIQSLNKNIFQHLIQNYQQIYLPQFPLQNLEQILQHYENQQSKGVIDLKFLSNIIVVNQTTKSKRKYSKSREKYIQELYSINKVLERLDQIWLCVYLFDRLNEMLCRKSNKNTINVKDIKINICTCLLISGKYSQIYPESLLQLFDLLGWSVDIKAVEQREREIFQYLNWNFNYVSEQNFYTLLLTFGNLSVDDCMYGLYLVHLGLRSIQLCQEKPSTKAAAILAMLTKGEQNQGNLDLYEKVGVLLQIKNQDISRVARIYSKLIKQQRKKAGIITQQFQLQAKRKIKLYYL